MTLSDWVLSARPPTISDRTRHCVWGRDSTCMSCSWDLWHVPRVCMCVCVGVCGVWHIHTHSQHSSYWYCETEQLSLQYIQLTMWTKSSGQCVSACVGDPGTERERERERERCIEWHKWWYPVVQKVDAWVHKAPPVLKVFWCWLLSWSSLSRWQWVKVGWCWPDSLET